VARFLEPEVSAAGVALHAEIPPQPLQSSYDEDRIKQMLVNLIRNAAEAAGTGGSVWVSVREAGNAVRLAVEDSGPGVPEGIDPFVPYFTTKDRGTGLGLPLAHRIAVEHGGTLYLARDAPRTTFVAEIPRSR
jgi:signal transduction histidine kinase